MRISFLFSFLLAVCYLFAQENASIEHPETHAIYVGYYAPFGIQIGTRAGIRYPFKTWTNETKKEKIRIYRLNVVPKLGYFVQPDVQRNYILDATLEYTWYQPSRSLHPKVGLGLGYLVARQNIGGTVDLATGEIRFEKRSLNFFAPTVSIGFEKNKAGSIGYYFSAFYGRKFTGQEVNSGFTGAEIGMIFNLKKKTGHG